MDLTRLKYSWPTSACRNRWNNRVADRSVPALRRCRALFPPFHDLQRIANNLSQQLGTFRTHQRITCHDPIVSAQTKFHRSREPDGIEFQSYGNVELVMILARPTRRRPHVSSTIFGRANARLNLPLHAPGMTGIAPSIQVNFSEYPLNRALFHCGAQRKPNDQHKHRRRCRNEETNDRGARSRAGLNNSNGSPPCARRTSDIRLVGGHDESLV